MRVSLAPPRRREHRHPTARRRIPKGQPGDGPHFVQGLSRSASANQLLSKARHALRAFRSPRTTLLRVRPVLHRCESRVRVRTVARHPDLLVDSLLVRRLPAHVRNVRKRLVKSSKTYVRNCGLLHALLGLPDVEAPLVHPITGAGWEGFVIESVLSVSLARIQPSFHRIADRAQTDLVLELPWGGT